MDYSTEVQDENAISRDDPQDDRGVLGELCDNVIAINIWPSHTKPVVYIRFRKPQVFWGFEKRMCLRITKSRDMAFEYSFMERTNEYRRFQTTCALSLYSFKSHGSRHRICLTSSHPFDSPDKIDIEFVWYAVVGRPQYKDVWIWRGGRLQDQHFDKVVTK